MTKGILLLSSFVLMALAAPARGAPRTVLVPSANNPLVALRVYFSVGAADDPAGKEGLASLTASMLGEGGTKERTWSEVLNALYPMAAQIRYYGDKDAFVFEGTVHRDNLAAYADLLAAQLLSPRFSEEDFARHKQDALDYVAKSLRGNDDENLGKQAFAAAMYGPHPYGRPTPGTVAGIGAITLDDVKGFYAQQFTRDRLIVGVAGGYPADFPKAFASRFDALPARGKPRRKLPPPPARKGADLLVVEKGAASNAISLGHPISVTRKHPDFYPLTVARSYLGEHRTFNGVLMINMRGKRGLNYGDYAYVENFIQDGWSTFPLPNVPRRQQHFEIWIRPVAPRNTGFALRQALYETDKLLKQGIPEEAFQATKAFLINYCDLWVQDVSRRLGYAIDAEVYGKDLIAELKKRLPKMKKADVDRALRKHLSTRNLAVAVVSDEGAALLETLTSGKPTPIVYDTKDTPPEIVAEDRIIEMYPLPFTKKRARVTPVDQMFAR